MHDTLIENTKTYLNELLGLASEQLEFDEVRPDLIYVFVHTPHVPSLIEKIQHVFKTNETSDITGPQTTDTARYFSETFQVPVEGKLATLTYLQKTGKEDTLMLILQNLDDVWYNRFYLLGEALCFKLKNKVWAATH